MSKKDYERIAAIFKANKPSKEFMPREYSFWALMLVDFATMLAKDNLRFKDYKFFRACGFEN